MGLDKYAPEGQSRVAQRTGYSRSAISRIFDGTRQPSRLSAERIADCLNITVAELYAELEQLQAARRRREER
jgi:transcriptional regulator with XRE-family HTH domain